MKTYNDLSSTVQEIAVQTVISGLCQAFIAGNPISYDDKVNAQLQKSLEDATTRKQRGEQIDIMLTVRDECYSTFYKLALDVARRSFYTEKNETTMSIAFLEQFIGDNDG